MRKSYNKPDKIALEKIIKEMGCREKQCEYFIKESEKWAWTFCKALFSEKHCEYKDGDEYIKYDN